MRYKIWNKIDKINNMEAEYFIKDLKIQEADEVFLIYDDYDNVQCIEIDRVVKSVYNMDINLSVDEVAKEYIRIIEEQNQQAKEEYIQIEEVRNKISILECENENLKQELALTQDAVNEILFMMMNMEVK